VLNVIASHKRIDIAEVRQQRNPVEPFALFGSTGVSTL
jgi:hypothetical protein